MSGHADSWSELAVLADALCEGDITPQQAQRLESLAQSPEAQRYLLQYLQLHGELFWDLGRQTQPSPQARTRRRFMLQWGYAGIAAAILIAVTLAGFFANRRGSPTQPAVATVERVYDAVIKASPRPRAPGSALAAGDVVELRNGLIEIAMNNRARVVLEGPAKLELVSPGRVFLHRGRLSAEVPSEAVGFTVGTAAIDVVDRGTAFGVAVDEAGWSEIHVFEGAVVLTWPNADARPLRALKAGEAVAVTAEASEPKITTVAVRRDRFVRSVPAQTHSVAMLRTLATVHPRLIHHFPFEGDEPALRLRDLRGDLHLMEVVMHDGRGPTGIETGVPGYDGSTRAVRLRRAFREGNGVGAALQSEAVFQPPPRMTVEFLALLDRDDLGPDDVAAAITTGQSSFGERFWLAAAEQGHLGLRLRPGDPWLFLEGSLELPYRLIPVQWHYIAMTARQQDGKTVVNVWIGPLDRENAKLQQVDSNASTEGTLAPGYLGIGKGFRENGAHAYPWPGALDEVAIYDTELTAAEIQRHWHAVAGNSP